MSLEFTVSNHTTKRSLTFFRILYHLPNTIFFCKSNFAREPKYTKPNYCPNQKIIFRTYSLPYFARFLFQQKLIPPSLLSLFCCRKFFGEAGIRTLGPLRVTRFPGVPIQPLSHLSRLSQYFILANLSAANLNFIISKVVSKGKRIIYFKTSITWVSHKIIISHITVRRMFILASFLIIVISIFLYLASFFENMRGP